MASSGEKKKGQTGAPSRPPLGTRLRLGCCHAARDESLRPYQAVEIFKGFGRACGAVAVAHMSVLEVAGAWKGPRLAFAYLLAHATLDDHSASLSPDSLLCLSHLDEATLMPAVLPPAPTTLTHYNISFSMSITKYRTYGKPLPNCGSPAHSADHMITLNQFLSSEFYTRLSIKSSIKSGKILPSPTTECVDIH